MSKYDKREEHASFMIMRTNLRRILGITKVQINHCRPLTYQIPPQYFLADFMVGVESKGQREQNIWFIVV